MEFDYTVVDPTGNITVLITTPYTEESRDGMIRRAFTLEPACEQVGFVMQSENADVRLEMMGYEFCGNATLSTAALHAYKNGTGEGDSRIVSVEASGAEDPIEVSVTRLPDLVRQEQHGSSRVCPVFEGTVCMPVPESGLFDADVKGKNVSFPVIHMNGISHIIVPEETAEEFTDGYAESVIRDYAARLDVPALGLLLCSDVDESSVEMKPLVFVRGSDTMVWEHGCATGSTAVGWYRHKKSGSNAAVDIIQEGGSIRISISDGRPFLTGRAVLEKY